GDWLAAEQVRAAMLVRMNSLLRGASGVRVELVERLAALLNAGATPRVPEFGSIGASGDLVPLAYIAGAAVGHAAGYEVELGGRVMPSADALAELELPPMPLQAKEALALINGTSASAGIAAACVHDARRLFAVLVGTHALAFQAMGGSTQALHPFVHDQKPHPGQGAVAAVLRGLLAGSRMSVDRVDERDGELIQDRYSIRTLPQYLGPTADALAQVAREVETELNSATDNPLVNPATGEILHGGNFQGSYLALGMDRVRHHLALLAKQMDAQLALLMTPAFSRGLPPSLSGNPARAVNVGMKPLQLTANSLLPLLLFHGQPIADRFPTHAEQFNQNVNSQSFNAARLTDRALRLMEHYLAAALIACVQAVDLRTHASAGHYDARALLSPATSALYDAVREVLACPPRRERPLLRDDHEQRMDVWMAAVASDLASDGRIAAAVADVRTALDALDCG
ncbi:MAG TPA: aromatic amino acid ammonia-lyase, partial [Longimicrobiaceae bacterium]|nr:aromatic amino acid ammonia-lyase [Longimicrobiaceae bacterium]